MTLLIVRYCSTGRAFDSPTTDRCAPGVWSARMARLSEAMRVVGCLACPHAQSAQLAHTSVNGMLFLVTKA